MQKDLDVCQADGRFLVRFKTAGSKNKNIVLHAARHNLREIKAELDGKDHGVIDHSRTRLNRRIHGPATAVETAALAKMLMKSADCKVRKNAALVLEVIFSLSSGTKIVEDAYFLDCLRWASDSFGGIDNVLCADVHRDQQHPHLHILIVPIKGDRLAGTEMMSGGIQRLAELNSNFFEKVAAGYGLLQGVQTALGRSKRSIAEDVIKRMMGSCDPATRSENWFGIREAIKASPYALAERLKIDTGRRAKKHRSMTDIFIGKGKGPTKEKISRCSRTEMDEDLSCVGVRNEPYESSTSEAGCFSPAEVGETALDAPAASPSIAPNSPRGLAEHDRPGASKLAAREPVLIRPESADGAIFREEQRLSSSCGRDADPVANLHFPAADTDGASFAKDSAQRERERDLTADTLSGQPAELAWQGLRRTHSFPRTRLKLVYSRSR